MADRAAAEPPLVATPANRLLHPPIGDTVDLIDAVRNAHESTLRSHCLDGECVRLLVAGDPAPRRGVRWPPEGNVLVSKPLGPRLAPASG